MKLQERNKHKLDKDRAPSTPYNCQEEPLMV